MLGGGEGGGTNDLEVRGDKTMIFRGPKTEFEGTEQRF